MKRGLGLLAFIVCGCGTSVEAPGADGGEAAIRFYEQVSPILLARCFGCHHDDAAERAAPFSVSSYAAVRPWAEAGLISYAVSNRIMPPWSANDDGDCGHYRDSLWLSEAEIATIVGWVDGGMVEGDPATRPELPARPGGLTGATHQLQMSTEYLAATQVSDDLRCFPLDPGLDRDMFLTGEEFHSTNYAVSHHAILYTLPNAAADARVQALDDADPLPGYSCYGGAGVDGAQFLIGWVPGAGAVEFPAGTGVRVPGGRRLVLQLHINYSQDYSPVLASIDLRLVDRVEREARSSLVPNRDIYLEPGQARAMSSFEFTVPGDAGGTIWGVGAHMHQRGLDMTIERVGAGEAECLARFEAWDFDWQRQYWYQEPVAVSGGDRLRLTCAFDTRTDSAPVTWGERTEDEMCIGLFYTTAP